MSKIKIRKALRTLSKMCDNSYCDSCPFQVLINGVYSGDDCGFKNMIPVSYGDLADDPGVKKFEEVLNNSD